MYEKTLLTDTALQTATLFGNFDRNIAAVEKAFGVSIANRDTEKTAGDAVVIRGEDSDSVLAAYTAMEYLKNMTEMGSDLSEQSVEYVISMVKGGEPLERFGDDCICVTTRGKPIKAKTLGQKKYIEAMEKNTVILGIGPAGTGKTFLAVAAASKALRNKQVSRIILTRPAVEAGEKLGFLPGDLQNKIDPYLRPLHDALFEMLGAETYQKHIERGTIEIAPLAYMRGRTLDDSFIILDEAQNTTPEQMKMFLTRLGSGSKAVVTGDITQTDLPRGTRSGLVEAMKILRGIEDIAIHEFTERDVVRHKLVQRIILAYEKYERERRAKSEKYHVAKKDRDK
ncbi:MAG: phosphate starvation-inducible protein PhoH [Clostridiales bacterium]|nr:MAG: phosphate starvation-inducible protein PhoH [Clostridiales bacterium]